MDNLDNNTPPKDHPILRTYHLISVLLSVGSMLFLLLMSANSSMGDAIVSAFLFGVICILLFQSLIVSFIYAIKIKTNRYWGLGVHLALIVVLLMFMAAS